MKVIIAGSRTIVDLDEVYEATRDSSFDITEVVSGCAPGVDRLGEAWAERSGIPITRFPADWKKYGRNAGFMRNGEMGEYAEALIAIWDGESPGTRHMIKTAEWRKLKLYVHLVVTAGKGLR